MYHYGIGLGMFGPGRRQEFVELLAAGSGRPLAENAKAKQDLVNSVGFAV
jgi:hypothetical protein